MAERTEHLEAVLLSAVRPSQEQEKRFLAFLAEKYGEGTTLTWQKSDDYPDGFRLEVGAEVYDWSAGGRLSQFKDALEKLAATQGDVIPLLKETVLSWTPQAMAQEVGTVLTVGDGIARVDPQGIRTLFEFCLSIRPICELLYGTGHQEVILRFYLQGAAPVIAQADAKTYYFIQFITFGLFGLMNAWVLGGYKETPEEMAQIVCAWKDASQEA